MAFFILGVLLVVVAIVLVAVVLSGDNKATGVGRSIEALEAMSSAPDPLKAELDRSFGERVLQPFQARALTIGRRVSGADAGNRIGRKLDIAGNPGDIGVDRIIALKVIGAVVFLVAGLAIGLVLGASFTVVAILTVAGLVLGFFSPDLYLYQLGYDRQNKLQRELPDALDLLTISVESGLGFDAAVQQVSRNTQGPLAEEFSRMLREMQIGSGRADALRGLATRTNVPEVRSFVGAMVQADAFGIPIAQVLRVQSSEMRVKRRQRAEEKAQQVPVKMTVPLIFCILPCLFLAVLGPAVISIMDSFK